ncbi:MAG TPA: hypothetical protein VM325_05885 [Alphaproteobacteria bacterium]|nr:hypothetical protein [Alphaproteobacteria bacterium]
MTIRIAASFVAVASATLLAQVAAAENFRFQGWAGGPRQGSRGGFQVCLATKHFPHGVILGLSYDREHLYGMGLLDPRWRFADGTRIAVRYSISGAPWRSATTTADRRSGIYFVLPERPSLSHGSAARIVVVASQNRLELRTPHLGTMIRRLERCQRQSMAALLADRSAAPTTGIDRPAAGLEHTPNANRDLAPRYVDPRVRRAARKIVRKVLDRAGLRRFRLISRRELGLPPRSDRLHWGEPGARVTGTLAILPVRGTRTEAGISTGIIEAARRLCRGARFGTGIKSIGPFANPRVVRFFVTCDAPGRHSGAYSIYPVRGGFYAVLHTSRRADAYLWRVDEAFYTQFIRLVPVKR